MITGNKLPFMNSDFNFKTNTVSLFCEPVNDISRYFFQQTRETVNDNCQAVS